MDMLRRGAREATRLHYGNYVSARLEVMSLDTAHTRE